MAPPMDLNEYLSRFPMVIWPLALPFFVLVPFGQIQCEPVEVRPADFAPVQELTIACLGCALYAVISFCTLLLVLIVRAWRAV